ncbi:hypothetical protein D3C73_799020 [compost metagenome]
MVGDSDRGIHAALENASSSFHRKVEISRWQPDFLDAQFTATNRKRDMRLPQGYIALMDEGRHFATDTRVLHLALRGIGQRHHGLEQVRIDAVNSHIRKLNLA